MINHVPEEFAGDYTQARALVCWLAGELKKQEGPGSPGERNWASEVLAEYLRGIADGDLRANAAWALKGLRGKAGIPAEIFRDMYKNCETLQQLWASQEAQEHAREVEEEPAREVEESFLKTTTGKPSSESPQEAPAGPYAGTPHDLEVLLQTRALNLHANRWGASPDLALVRVVSERLLKSNPATVEELLGWAHSFEEELRGREGWGEKIQNTTEILVETYRHLKGWAPTLKEQVREAALRRYPNLYQPKLERLLREAFSNEKKVTFKSMANPRDPEEKTLTEALDEVCGVGEKETPSGYRVPERSGEVGAEEKKAPSPTPKGLPATYSGWTRVAFEMAAAVVSRTRFEPQWGGGGRPSHLSVLTLAARRQNEPANETAAWIQDLYNLSPAEMERRFQKELAANRGESLSSNQELASYRKLGQVMNRLPARFLASLCHSAHREAEALGYPSLPTGNPVKVNIELGERVDAAAVTAAFQKAYQGFKQGNSEDPNGIQEGFPLSGSESSDLRRTILRRWVRGKLAEGFYPAALEEYCREKLRAGQLSSEEFNLLWLVLNERNVVKVSQEPNAPSGSLSQLTLLAAELKSSFERCFSYEEAEAVLEKTRRTLHEIESRWDYIGSSMEQFQRLLTRAEEEIQKNYKQARKRVEIGFWISQLTLDEEIRELEAHVESGVLSLREGQDLLARRDVFRAHSESNRALLRGASSEKTETPAERVESLSPRGNPQDARTLSEKTPMTTGQKIKEQVKSDAQQIALRTGVRKFRKLSATLLAKFMANKSTPRLEGESEPDYQRRLETNRSGIFSFLLSEAGQGFLGYGAGTLWTVFEDRLEDESVRQYGGVIAEEVRIQSGTDVAEELVGEFMEQVGLPLYQFLQSEAANLSLLGSAAKGVRTRVDAVTSHDHEQDSEIEALKKRLRELEGRELEGHGETSPAAAAEKKG